MTDNRIRTLQWGLPADWIAWPYGHTSEAEPEVVALGEDAATTSKVLAAVEEFETAISRGIPGTSSAALWVPVAGVRQPLATAALRVAAPPPTGRPDVEAALELARHATTVPAWTKLLDVAAAPSRVTAGDAVLRIVDKSPRMTRRVSREWTWIVLPPGTERMVLCQVESSAVAHFDALAEMATDIANSVTVILEPA